MQVSHIEQKDTHAVIGGSKVRSFQMAQTAEFFEILSNQMYSNKPLAVVREVLCNAWDIHIASGKTNIPVEVTITDDKMIIRDYGTGISDDNITENYCTYGNSTKANDGTQTGGFGLGSKAPFAYTDHFTVTSYHNHLKTVYAISRGSPLTGGVPDIRVMVSIATTEVGLEVNIPIKSIADAEVFKELVKQLACFGEMYVKLNGEALPTFPISTSAKNMFIMNGNHIEKSIRKSIMIRYGNVIYPVYSHEQYEYKYTEIVNKLAKIPSGTDYRDPYAKSATREWVLILQAAPNTISVTPSRESLSMTEVTVETIKNLLTEVNTHIVLNGRRYKEILTEEDNKVIKHLIDTGRVDCLFNQDRLNRHGMSKPFIPEYFVNMEDISRHIYNNTTDRFSSDWQRNALTRRLDAIINTGYRNKHNIQKYKHHIRWSMKKYTSWNLPKNVNIQFFKMFQQPLLKRMRKAEIDIKNFQILGRGYSKGSKNGYLYKSITHNIKEFEDVNTRLKQLQSRVILTASKNNLIDKWYHTPWQSGQPKAELRINLDNQYVYIVSDKTYESVKKFFEKENFEILDFYAWYKDWLSTQPVEIKVKAKPVKKVIGLGGLANILKVTKYGAARTVTPNGHLHNLNEPDYVRIEKPEVVFQAAALQGGEYNHHFYAWSKDRKLDWNVTNYLLSKNKNIGVAVNTVQKEAWMKKGAVDGYDFLIDNLIKDYWENPKIQNYFQLKKLEYKGDITPIINIASGSKIISESLGIPSGLDESDIKAIWILEKLMETLPNYQDTNKYADQHRNLYKPYEKRFAEEVTSKPLEPSPVINKIGELIKDNDKLRYLNLELISQKINDPDTPIQNHIFMEMTMIMALGL